MRQLLTSLILMLAILPLASAQAGAEREPLELRASSGVTNTLDVREIRRSIKKHCACLRSSVCSGQSLHALGGTTGFVCEDFAASRLRPVAIVEAWDSHEPEVDPPPPRLIPLHRL